MAPPPTSTSGTARGQEPKYRVHIPRLIGHWRYAPDDWASIQSVSPFPIVDDEVRDGEPLLVIVQSGAGLHAARELQNAGHPVVVWAWRCSEVIAQRAENEFPVVYGAPTEEMLWDARTGLVQETSLLSEIEQTFGFPDVLVN